MVPSLSVHVAAASVKATLRCPHWAACLANKHHYVGTARGTSVLVAVSSQREWVWPLTRFASRKWRSGLNRISHPDWVKLSVEINWAPNQNTRFSASLQYFFIPSYCRILIHIYFHTVLSEKWIQSFTTFNMDDSKRSIYIYENLLVQ